MLKTILIAAVLFYGALALFAWLTADRQIFLPPPRSYSERDLPISFVPSEEARIAVVHLPNPESDFTILISHGNAEDLGHLAPFLHQMRAAGFGVLAWDYRGYGLSSGGPTTAGSTLRDIEAVYAHATGELGIDPESLIVHGRSVGSGPATHLAAHAPVAGLILENAFTSAFRVVTRWPILPFDRFPNLRNIERVDAPVLVIHGTSDRIVPASHGRQLYARAPGPKQALWVERAGHNDLLWVAGERYWDALRRFRELLANPSRSAP